jgi:hypothetical protein
MSINYTPDNTFIFSFVRMNPPTPGHLVLIKTMIDKAIELGSNKIYILTSSSLDGKNPVPCSDESIPKPKNKTDTSIINQMTSSNIVYKSNIIYDMIMSYKQQLIHEETDPTRQSIIANLNIIVLCSSGNPFGFIYSIIENDFINRGIQKINLYFIVGRDRADFLDRIVDYYIQNKAISSVDGEILGREGMDTLKTSGIGERTIADINPSEYSASFVRGLVKNNQREEFEQVYNIYLSPEQINELYETIKLGMALKLPAFKDENENPHTKYFIDDPNNPGQFIKQRLPLINTSGGKKRTRKNKRTRKTKKMRKSNRKYSKRT